MIQSRFAFSSISFLAYFFLIASSREAVPPEATRDVLPAESVDQYVKEERSLLAKRAASESQRLHDLVACMKEDHISVEGKIDELKGELFSLQRLSRHFYFFDKQ